MLIEGHGHSALYSFRRAIKLAPKDAALKVYEQQAQLQVRGYIRKICSQYPDFAAAFRSSSANSTSVGSEA